MHPSFRSLLALAGTTAVLAGAVVVAQSAPEQQRARDIYKQLIEINTTEINGSTTKAAEAMAERLKAAGFPAADVQVLGPNDRKGNLVARLRGSGLKKPMLLLAHLDVVEAKREDWSFDPFVFLEKDGYFYGRGTADDKAMASALVANLIRLKQEGFKPDRDLILALTADEETGPDNGPAWLLKNHRALVEAELAINEGGGGQMKNGKYLVNQVQASEKVYMDFKLTVKNAGGHSSQPKKDNAIYHLAEGLGRIGKFDFPVKMNEVTRGYFAKMAALQADPALQADMRAIGGARPDPQAVNRMAENSPYFNALMRTTCVATMLNGGHATNALPQLAEANVNCRMLPGEDPEEVRRTLQQVAGDKEIAVDFVEKAKPSAPSSLSADIMGPIEEITQRMWPGVVVVPVMGTGATDSLYLRNAGIRSYGVSGMFHEMDDNRAHGRDERIGVKQYYEGVQFLYDLVKAVAK